MLTDQVIFASMHSGIVQKYSSPKNPNMRFATFRPVVTMFLIIEKIYMKA